MAYHQYALDAAPLLSECIETLQLAIDQDLLGNGTPLRRLKDVLLNAETILQDHLEFLLEREQKQLSNGDTRYNNGSGSMMDTLSALERMLQERKRQERKSSKSPNTSPKQDLLSHSHHSSRSATDTMMFQLIVALQLCSLRLSDYVMTGDQSPTGRESGDSFVLLGALCLLGSGIATSMVLRRPEREGLLSTNLSTTKVMISLGSLAVIKLMHSKVKALYVRDKIQKSTVEIEEWIHQWEVVKPREDENCEDDSQEESMYLDHQSRRLIEYAAHRAQNSSTWQYSEGEIRFFMLKRFMDVYYASVSTAIDTNHTSYWQLPLVTGAAASFYSLTGASRKAAQAVTSSSRDLIQHAWGMVNLPAVKSLMSQASKLIKGASVVDRITICGVSCFVLSRDPAPELGAAIRKQRGYQQAMASKLSTIEETEETVHEEMKSESKSFAGTCGSFRQRDIIFHLTGGGFFSHIIGSDLPYLLDWSASTGAVVICPEYALLPDHAFPVALNQIAAVYSTLVNGNATADLGFEVNRIVVTGESTGGNLAAALCVKIIEATRRSEETKYFDAALPRLPDSMMLCCAALNLSLELSHSRIIGKEDPVLPSGLIAAISDAYLPDGASKTQPLASPIFASDAVLRSFPPVMLFAGSTDPLLDDSVIFNGRLRSLGVQSELRAVRNVPHAYWGLGTAGFPEALQVQKQCQEWLAKAFGGQSNE